MAWSDNTYSIHLVDEAERALPSGSAGHALLQAIVVEANTGRVAALRVCTFSPDFTAALEGAILEQSRRLFDREDWDRRGAALYARFRDSETLARAAQHRCRGGA